MKKSDIEKMHAARAELARMLRPGDTVYTRLEHVSRSGMTRRISVMVMRENEPQNITYTVAHALGDGRHLTVVGMMASALTAAEWIWDSTSFTA